MLSSAFEKNRAERARYFSMLKAAANEKTTAPPAGRPLVGAATLVNPLTGILAGTLFSRRASSGTAQPAAPSPTERPQQPAAPPPTDRPQQPAEPSTGAPRGALTDNNTSDALRGQAVVNAVLSALAAVPGALKSMLPGAAGAGAPQGGQQQIAQPQPGQAQGGQQQIAQPQPGQAQGGQQQIAQPQPGQAQGGQQQTAQPQPGQAQGGQQQTAQPQTSRAQAGQPRARYGGQQSPQSAPISTGAISGAAAIRGQWAEEEKAKRLAVAEERRLAHQQMREAEEAMRSKDPSQVATARQQYVEAAQRLGLLSDYPDYPGGDVNPADWRRASTEAARVWTNAFLAARRGAPELAEALDRLKEKYEASLGERLPAGSPGENLFRTYLTQLVYEGRLMKELEAVGYTPAANLRVRKTLAPSTLGQQIAAAERIDAQREEAARRREEIRRGPTRRP